MHDILALSQTTHKWIWGCKSVNNWVESDHIDVTIKLAIKFIKFKHNKVIKRVTELRKIVTDEGYITSYCDTLKYIVDDST